MGVTRRYLGEAGLVVVLAGLAVPFDRPWLLVGAASVGGWLVARQFSFVRTVADVRSDLSVTQSTERDLVAVDDDVRVTLTIELPYPAPVTLEVEAQPPPGVEVVGKDDRAPTVVVPPDETSATTTFSVQYPLAGSFEFDEATVTATDRTGRFRTSFDAGTGPTVTVEARSLRNLHVGVGGEGVKSAYGRHLSEERGPGIDLAEIRAYVPGDAVRHIDWNATARLDEPHVREFETTTERSTALVLDRRTSMATGPPGETKFDYARQVALGVVSYAHEQNEPVALYEVGAEGLLARYSATATGEGYARLERRLRAVEPEDESRQQAENDDRSARTERAGDGVLSPAIARQRSAALRDDDSAFADRLRPFFVEADSYVERVAEDPLYEVTRSSLGDSSGGVTAVVLTDDAHRTETQQAAKLAHRHADHVLALLTPTVLFDSERADPETTYERYADFEQFRRNLVSVENVSAFEVGPGDRLEAILAKAESRRRTRAGESR